MREARGLTQRQLAHELGISQNYIPAIESGARRPGPKLQEQFVKFFRCRFGRPLRGCVGRSRVWTRTGASAAELST